MITYKIVEKKKPGTQDFKYYGQIATVKPMGIRELCKKVAHATTATPLGRESRNRRNGV